MKLDFITLFVIILLNSVGFAIVWAIISISYRSLKAARFWFAALLMTFLSGPFLILGEQSPWLNYLGNTLVIFGFGLIWQGVRVFRQLPPQWGWLTILIAISVLAMIFLGTSQPANNVIFAVSQIILMIMALITLLSSPNRQIGTWIASGSCALMIIGQSLEAGTNTLRLLGYLSTDIYYNYASWFLVLAIIGVSFSNLGFLLMTVDQMRNELYGLAVRDELTGLPNRRALMDKLIQIEKTAKHMQSCVTTCMIDLDKFKIVNDLYGHSAGDGALIHLSAIIQRNLRVQDFFARLGGDEFCILMSDLESEEAQIIIQKITKDIKSSPFIWEGEILELSASIGIHYWHYLSGLPLKLSLSLADENLINKKYGSSELNQLLIKPSTNSLVQPL